MPLPDIPQDNPNGRYTPTRAFVEGMIESFKQGGKVPKRVAWEIILGVQRVVEKQKSLVEVVVHKGATCDVVGDSELVGCGMGARGGDGERWMADTQPMV
jgi:serine/threonine-protein phosphatase 5